MTQGQFVLVLIVGAAFAYFLIWLVGTIADKIDRGDK